MNKIISGVLALAVIGGGGFGGWQLMARWRALPADKTLAPIAAPAAERAAPARAAAIALPPAPDALSPMAAGEKPVTGENSVALPPARAEKPATDTPLAAAPELPALPAVPAAPTPKPQPAPTAAKSGNSGAVFAQADAKMRQRDFAGARALLEKSLRPGTDPANAAALYRLGLCARYANDEKAAQEAWGRAHREYPLTPAGRLSAIALGDTFYAWYAGKEPQFDRWETIRDLYSDALGMDGARFLDPATEARIAEALNRLNERLVFSPDMKVRGAQFHRVQPGENLTTIARRYNLDSWRSLVAINHINPSALRVGDRLKIITGRVFILVNKRTFTLSWYLDGVFIRRYRCATGAVGSETPPGRYKIVRMDVNPEWRDPNTGRIYKYGEPGHAIGSRWMAMEGEGTHGLGIHGTIDPDSMGKKASNGCVRLLKKDVEELYGFVSIQRGNESEVLVIE